MIGLPTIVPGQLSVASAFPDPPFEVVLDGVDTGLDVDLMETVCTRLGLRRTLVRYTGRDFDRIFDGLGSRAYDAVVSGTTITAERAKVALFSDPYLESGQSLVVNVERSPHVKSTDDLEGEVVGIQVGNTSDIVARELKARGAIADIRYYPYGGIEDALADLSAGRIGAFIKLLPVMTWLTRGRPELAVVQEIPTHERIGVAVAPDNAPLCRAINRVLADLREAGELDRLTDRWLR